MKTSSSLPTCDAAYILDYEVLWGYDSVKVDISGTPCKKDLDWAYYSFKQSYLNYYAKFLYSLFNTFILDSFPQTL